MRRAAFKIALLTILVIIVAWPMSATMIDHYGLTRNVTERFDVIVIPGCAVRPNNEPSDALRRRVTLGIALFHRGVAPKIIFTGGVGGGTISEAEASARFAESFGISRSDMVLEDQSHSTYENARFARALTSAQRVLVATDGFHVLRSERIFRRYFRYVRGVGTTSTYAATRWWGAYREVPLLIGDVFKRD